MWDDLLAALALVLVIEGVLPFLSPRLLRETWQSIARLNDRALRIMGLVFMLAGALLLHWVR